MNLLSDLLIERADGVRLPLDQSFTLPVGLLGVGGDDSGSRAPDSKIVVRSGDNISTVYSVTLSGVISAQSPTQLLDKLDTFSNDLKQCVKLWRGSRAYLSIAYAILPPVEMRQGWMSCTVTPIFRLSYLAWRREDGTEVFG